MSPDAVLKPGDVVQLSPDVGNPAFAYCLMVVLKTSFYGADGYVQAPGVDGEPSVPEPFYAPWDHMEPVGRAEWFIELEPV